jgi:hypothetical protein
MPYNLRRGEFPGKKGAFMATQFIASIVAWRKKRRGSAARMRSTRITVRSLRVESLETRTLLAVLNGHEVLLDDSGKIVPWDVASADPYDSYLRRAWNFIKTQVPNAPGDPPLSDYPQYFFYDGYLTTDPAIVPDNWMNDPGEKIPNWVESAQLYYAYTGDTSVMDIVRGLVDYTIAHGTSPSTFAWPNFPHTTDNYGQAEFTGFTGEFALHEIQVDLAADMGLAYYRMYQFYGDAKYLTAAVNVADVLASHARVGTTTQSVWPYGVTLDDGAITAEYGANWTGAYSLLTELVAANIGNVSAYTAAAALARDFILNVPMQTLLDPWGNMEGNWTDGHSDTPINDSTYKSNMSKSNAALYILAHPEFDPNWQTDVPNMIQWTETWFVDRTTADEPANFYGANVVGEQDVFNYKMTYQTARYAAECALWYRESGDPAYLEKAYRALNFVTYCSDADGRATESPFSTWISSWWSDNYGEGPRMFYRVFAAMPEWAPAGENHVLYSEDVVHDVSYAAEHVGYTAASGEGTEYLRVSFLPDAITVNRTPLSLRSDLSAEGYTLRSLGGGDYALTIHHTGATATPAAVSIGRGGGELIIDGTTLQIDQGNVISSSTSVTIRNNGTLDLGGTTQTANTLTLESGSVLNGALDTSSYTIYGGTITATIGPGSIVKQTAADATVTTPINATSLRVEDGQLSAPSVTVDSLSIGAAPYIITGGTITETLGPGPIIKRTAAFAMVTNPIQAVSLSVEVGQLTVPSVTVDHLSIGLANAGKAVTEGRKIGAATTATRAVAITPDDSVAALAIPGLSVAAGVLPIASTQLARVAFERNCASEPQIALPAINPIALAGESIGRAKLTSEARLDHPTLPFATEQTASQNVVRRHRRAVDAALTDATSYLSEFPDWPVRRPVARRYSQSVRGPSYNCGLNSGASSSFFMG